jgi:type 1 glutamine amidotransferase
MLAGSAALAQSPPAPTAAAPTAGGAPPRGLPDVYAGKKKLLIWADVQSGFHHDSINHAMAVIEKLGRDSGAYVSFLRTDSQSITKQPITGRGTRYTGRGINARNLNDYDAIFFLGSGEGTLTPEQKKDLLAFVRDDGKGFVAGHAAIVAFYDWPDFLDMVGGFMASEFPVASTAIKVDDMAFPGANAFGSANFSFPDQYPVLAAPYAKGKVHTILRLDPAQLTEAQKARRPDGDLPIAWAKPYGKGRVYYSSFGHPDAAWDDPRVQKMYLEAIKWSLGLTSAAVPPDRP